MEKMIVKMEVMKKDASTKFSIPKKLILRIYREVSSSLTPNQHPKALHAFILGKYQKIKEVLDFNLISSPKWFVAIF